MKFEDDLVEEVMAQAPDGVQFEPDEVCDALVRAVDSAGAPFAIFTATTAVQRAANRAVQRRRAEAAEPEPELDVHPGEGNA